MTAQAENKREKSARSVGVTMTASALRNKDARAREGLYESHTRDCRFVLARKAYMSDTCFGLHKENKDDKESCASPATPFS